MITDRRLSIRTQKINEKILALESSIKGKGYVQKIDNDLYLEGLLFNTE
jgi:hypothetical protein